MEESSVSLSVSESKALVDSLEENRQAAENLAINTINFLQIPLLNSMLCLSKEDCLCILECSNRCKNMIEQSLLLITVTDFMSCVCANDEKFPLPLQSRDTIGIKLCLSKLKNRWCKFFREIGVEDMSLNQVSSIMSLLRRCLERVPNEHYKMFLEVILKMSEQAMSRLNEPQKKIPSVDVEKNIGLIIGKDISKEATSDNVSKAMNGLKKSQKKVTSVMNRLKKSQKKVTSVDVKKNKGLIIGKDISKEASSDNVSKAMNRSKKKVTSVDVKKNKGLIVGKNISKEVTSDNVSKESNLKDKLKNHLPPRINNSKVKKSKNLPGDITRFILKPCENQVGSANKEEIDTPRNMKNEISCEKHSVNAASVKENKNDSAGLGSPLSKKQCLDNDLVDGKVNAFKQLMMAQKIKVKKNVIKIVVKK